MREQTSTRTLNDDTCASDPGQITLSHNKLRLLRPDLYGIRGAWKSLLVFLRMGFPQRIYIEEQLLHGDSRAAVVISVSPLLIAAYTDELECIAMLRFPDELVHQYHLSVGTKLLTVNCYKDLQHCDPDLILDPDHEEFRIWTGFHPLIAEFLTDDYSRVQARKSEITSDEWQRAFALGQRYAQLRPGVARDGRPIYSSVPAEAIGA